MNKEIEELLKLAEECREWLRACRVEGKWNEAREFERLATELDRIAKALAPRLPT